MNRQTCEYVKPQIQSLSARGILEALGPVSAGSVRAEPLPEQPDQRI
jgi:hypothetical protein